MLATGGQAPEFMPMKCRYIELQPITICQQHLISLTHWFKFSHLFTDEDYIIRELCYDDQLILASCISSEAYGVMGVLCTWSWKGTKTATPVNHWLESHHSVMLSYLSDAHWHMMWLCSGNYSMWGGWLTVSDQAWWPTGKPFISACIYWWVQAWCQVIKG